jgi:hypothetical protein
MTNRQAKGNPIEPRRAFQMLGKLLGGLAAFGVLAYIIATADSSLDAAMAVVWAYVAKSLMDSGVRDVLAQGRAEQAEAARQAENTGVWKAAEAGSFTVRFEPLTGVYWLSGWVEPDHELTSEVAYASAAGVCSIVEAAEAEGMIPEDDEATRAIRARLMVKGWEGSLGVQGGSWLSEDLGIHPRPDGRDR